MQTGHRLWQAAGFLSISVETILRIYGHHHPDYQREAAENIGKRPHNVRVIGDVFVAFRVPKDWKTFTNTG